MAKKIDLALASPQQVNEIQSSINHLEKMLEVDRRRPTPKIQDTVEFKAEIKKKKELIAKHAPKALRGKNKDKAWKKAKELGAYLQEHMPRSKAYHQKYPKGDCCDNSFERAVQQQMAFQTNPKLQKAAQEYKYLMGRLEPSDPYARNIERLRQR